MDKSKPSHSERTVYVSPDVTPGSSLRYGDWNEGSDLVWVYRHYDQFGPVLDSGHYVRGVPLTLIEHAVGSDYSGNLVQASNARCLKRDFPWLVEVYGGHGTFGVAYLGRRENQSDALIEAIDSLADYPLYDDSDHSELEHAREIEAWEDDGRDDFKRALVKYFDAQYEPDEHDLDSDEFNAQVDALWYAATDRLCGGESFLNESGDSIYFPIDRVIEKFARSWPGMSRNGYDGSPSLNRMLVRLAEACTISEDETKGDE